MWEAVFRGLSDVLGVECVRGEGMSQVTTGVQLGYQRESQSLRQRMLKEDCVLAEDPEFASGLTVSGICETGRRRPVGSLMSQKPMSVNCLHGESMLPFPSSLLCWPN